MNIVVNEDLKAYIDPLTPEEYAALERSLLAEGCRDALVLWGETLVDGHNRFEICQRHGIPFQTVQSQLFQCMEDVHLWMIEQHLGRRSVSDFQRGVLALRKRDLVAQRRAQYLAQTPAVADDASPPWEEGDGAPLEPAQPSAMPLPPPLKSRDDVARAARLSANQVVMIEKIQKQAAPELVNALKTGAINLSTAAAVATLPAEEQVQAAQGGKDELKQAAKRVRESKRKPRPALAEGTTPAPEGAVADAALQLQALQQQVQALLSENEALRKQVANLLQQLVR